MVATAPFAVKLKSKPYKKRVGLIPMTIAILFGFVFSFMWMTLAGWLVVQGTEDLMVWGIVIGLCSSAYLGYLSLAGYKLVADGKREYVVELTDSEAVLVVVDRMAGRRAMQMVLLDDIKYAEYYPFPDTSSVILHAPYTQMELPLWPFGQQAQDVLDFLEGRGVKICNVMSDEAFPE